MEDGTAEQLFYNAILTIKGNNHPHLSRLYERFGTWRAAWKNVQSSLEKPCRPEELFKKLSAYDVRLILRDDPDYPPLLKEIHTAPWGIYVRGTLPPAKKVFIAIVGTRKATEGSVTLAETFGKQLALHGAIIISGLALGIDAAAHRGCLAGEGVTIAVLAHGLDQCYPRTNEALARRILEHSGALISEYPLFTPSYPNQFLERNRIVSGLARGTVVVEAPRESGSLATARFAFEENRDVFVVPGPARHPHFMGSHDLIRGGAELVTGPEHVVEAYDLAPPLHMVSTGETTDAVLHVLREARRPLDIDTISGLTNLDVPLITQALGFLVIDSRVREIAGKYSIL